MEKESNSRRPACAACDLDIMERACILDTKRGGKGCPTLTRKEVLEQANKEYDDAFVREFARQASIQEAECYANRDQRPYVMQPTKTRIVEICEFAQKMGYKRLGLAFCLGLATEAAAVAAIIEKWGYEVVSVACKAGRTSKGWLGLTPDEHIYKDLDEPLCNPIYQAKLLNYEQTEFNVLVGLCVGHDSMFFKYVEAPTTVLAVKDRVTGHNPLAAVYLGGSYHQKINHPGL